MPNFHYSMDSDLLSNANGIKMQCLVHLPLFDPSSNSFRGISSIIWRGLQTRRQSRPGCSVYLAPVAEIRMRKQVLH